MRSIYLSTCKLLKMIQGTIIKDISLKLVLTGTDDIDSAVLKQLNGASCTFITENLRLGDKVITGGIIISTHPKTSPENPLEEVPV